MRQAMIRVYFWQSRAFREIVYGIITIGFLLFLLSSCSSISFTARTADEVFGPARTLDARLCRMEEVIVVDLGILARPIIRAGDPGAATNFLRALRGVLAALADARASAPEYQEYNSAVALEALARLTQSQLSDFVRALAVNLAVMSPEQAIDAGADFAYSSGVAAAAASGVAQAVQAIDAGTRTLAQCREATDRELEKLESALRAASGGA